MVYGKRRLLAAFVLTALAGCLLHGVYSLWPNGFTALFSPVRESLWEHLKILVWPYLAAALVLNRDRPTGMRPWLLALLGMSAAMLAAGYFWHITLGGEAVWADIGLYVLLLAFGFWIPSRFSGPFRGVKWILPVLGTAALIALTAVFALYPPDGLLFVDLSGADVWSRLPC